MLYHIKVKIPIFQKKKNLYNADIQVNFYFTKYNFHLHTFTLKSFVVDDIGDSGGKN